MIPGSEQDEAGPLTSPDRAERLAREAGRRLRIGYALGLLLIAALTLGSHGLFAAMLATSDLDAATLNLAGRQRMLSQRIVKESALLSAGIDRPGGLAALDADLAEIASVEKGLREGDAERSIEAVSGRSERLAAALVPMRAAYLEFHEAAARVRAELAGGGPAASLPRLLESEAVFLPRMDETTTAYERWSAGKLTRIKRVHLMVGAALLSVLVLEALLLFRPAVQRIRRQMFELAISQERTQLLATVAEHTRHAVLLAEADGTISWVNPAAEATFHACTSDVPRLSDAAPCGMAPQVEAAIVSGRDLHLDDVASGAASYALDLVAVRDERGVPRRYVLVVTDLTERAHRERDQQGVQRRAGRADVAVTILHNVGNTLNSLALAATSAEAGVRESRLPGLARALDLLGPDAARASAFLGDDPRGERLPQYLQGLHARLEAEQDGLRADLETVLAGIEHLRHVVARENDAVGSTAEARDAALADVTARALVEDALRLYGGSATVEGVPLEAADIDADLVLHADRHVTLQILGNLITNAVRATRDAAGEHGEAAAVEVCAGRAGGFTFIEVVDRGVGLGPERLPSLFTARASTTPGGQGIGLNSSANAATAMGGRLEARSDGPGRGAAFRLELPTAATGSTPRREAA